jgi:hypothetical protein
LIGGDKREFFIGQKAVDKLMESNFHKKNAKGSDSPIVPDRDHAIAMLTFFMKLGQGRQIIKISQNIKLLKIFQF